MMGNEQRVRDGGDTFDVAALMAAARDRLRAARAISVPNFPAASEPLPEPGAGQIWRARWDKTATAVLLLADPDHEQVEVAAVTFDPDLADSNAVVMPATGTTMGIRTVFWFDTARRIPLATLDTHLGTVTASTSQGPLAANELRHFKEKAGKGINDGVMRASIIDALRALERATWVLETTGDLKHMLAGIRNSELAAAIGVTFADALQLKRGQRPLQFDEATKLAPVIGHSIEELVATANPLPGVIIDLFNSPSVRARIITLARATGADEITTRRACAYAVYAAAARATGRNTDTERDQWRQRIDQYLDTHLSRDQ